MLYLADDLHHKQMTINLCDEAGEVVLRRQVSTWGEEPPGATVGRRQWELPIDPPPPTSRKPCFDKTKPRQQPLVARLAR